ncbi:MAG: hypothetical protein BEN19_06330 [Epulopiscium sp. Nuni2H_MBin003]|nr:MAG: hypothetical protein BEN19_06330 [Epulopiscium sp. Nuni2H_MBin003]
MIKRLIFPNMCVVCKRIIEDGYVCTRCQLNLIDEYTCPNCEKPYNLDLEECTHCSRISDITAIKALFEYEGLIRNSIFRWKYQGFRKYARAYATEFYYQLDHDLQIDALIPVPISKQRFRERGFNQATDLATHLSSLINVPVADVLVKHKHTKRQSECTKKERAKNNAQAISINKEYVDIIKKDVYNFAIVDDIYTTGSTVKECIKILKGHYNIEKIYVFVICK